MNNFRIMVETSLPDANDHPRWRRLVQFLKRTTFLFVQITDSLSCLLNAVTGGNACETLSSRAYRTDTRFWRTLQKWLDLLLTPRTRDYCKSANWRCLERSKALLGNRFL